jgi:ATP-binding cassette subfamily C (CFTR/MRP) protein 1
MDFSSCLDDDTFGPAVQRCRDGFDFTIKFERIFLSLIPAAIFIALALTRVVFLVSHEQIVTGPTMQRLKVVSQSQKVWDVNLPNREA